MIKADFGGKYSCLLSDVFLDKSANLK